jgi:GNAT superfamily N-acetyltransferase
VRAATPADVPLLLDLIRGLAAYEKLSRYVTATRAGLRQALFGPRPAAEAVIGLLDGKPAGFAVFFPNFSTFLGRAGMYLEDLYVIPEARGRGLGEALLRHVAREAVRRRCGRFEWAALDWNTPAIGFYRKLGAVPLDDWTVFRVTGTALRRLGKPAIANRRPSG